MMMGRRRHGPLVLLRETEPTQVKTRRVWAMLALAHRCTDAVVHLTPEAAADAQARLRWLHRPARTHVIANGLDTDFFSPAPQPRPADGVLRIGMQSRLQPTKDHLTLIEAFAALRTAHPGRALTLEIAGDGPTRPQIEARIAALGLGGAVTRHGLLGREGVRDFLRGLDLYVHSTFGETQSNAIMQAMATGLPVVASEVAGVSNMIRPGLGLLHRSGDAGDLARQMGRLIDDPALAQDLGRAARAQALAVYGAGASARGWEALIARLRGEAA
jgi:glycosyltransferase involved in cell wall biosynthesis